MANLRRFTETTTPQSRPDTVKASQFLTTRFATDARASRFTVKAFASGMSAGLGHNPTIAIRDFQGEGEFDKETLDKARVTLRIRAESLKVEDEMRDDDRCLLERIMREDVLATEEFPEIVFESSAVAPLKMSESVYQVRLTGKLSLRNVTRRLHFVSMVTLGAYNLRANGEFEIKQSDFGIKPVSIAGGSMTVQDELKFGFFIVAKLRE